MFNMIDLIGIAIVLISALIAFKRGFVKTFFGFISTFIAIILAFALCNQGVELLKQNTELDEKLEITITNAITKKEENNLDTEIEKDVAIVETEDISKEDKTKITEIFSELPQTLQDVVGMEEYKNSVKTTLIEKSIEIILKVLSWIIIYVSVRIILLILCILFDGIMNIPFLKQINNIAGLILGAILGLFRVYVVLAFISFLVSVVAIEPVVEAIKSSMVISTMYDNNLLIHLIF